MDAASPTLDQELPTPNELRTAVPVPNRAAIDGWRRTIVEAIAGTPQPLVVVLGPCSIHDTAAALEYAHWLRGMADRFAPHLRPVMRAYVEKARTRGGWNGFINDPSLDGRGDMAGGLIRSRQLFADLNALGLPVATEFVGISTPSYLVDLVTWAAIGARTVESPAHREMAAWLPCPVGFKNTMSGGVLPALNAMFAVRQPQTVRAVGSDGSLLARRTAGNPASHLVLRGGPTPNFDADAVLAATRLLHADGLPMPLMIDCSHGNSGGVPTVQLQVARYVAGQIAGGSTTIMGVMLESHLRGGRQALVAGQPPVYGQSITDACLDLEQTEAALELLANGVVLRGQALTAEQVR